MEARISCSVPTDLTITQFVVLNDSCFMYTNFFVSLLALFGKQGEWSVNTNLLIGYCK